MSKFFRVSEEQKMIRKFYKEFLSWKSENIGMWIGAGFVEMFLLLSAMVPFQEVLGTSEIEKTMIIMVAVVGWLAPFLYIMPYVTFKEEQKDCSITAKLKYLPVDIKEIQKMRVTYLVKFVVKQFLAALVLQILTSMYSYGEITWANVWYIVVAALVWPLVVNMPVAIVSRRYE